MSGLTDVNGKKQVLHFFNESKKCYSVPQVISKGTWHPLVGYSLIKNASIEIGGQVIEEHDALWMKIWSQLTTSASKYKGLEQMIGLWEPNQKWVPNTLHIPLNFWFCEKGLELPLIALQYHDVKLKIDFEELQNIATTTISPSLTTCNLWVDYVYLDTDERRRFAQHSHEYLITQVQHIPASHTKNNYTQDLYFNHPCKEIIWTFDKGTTYDTAELTLNGHPRFTARKSDYFYLVQPYQHHTGIPFGISRSRYSMYSFALFPERQQPTGSCNFSRIDNARLNFTGISSPGTLNVYAVNYNVLRIVSGMGGLAFSN